MQFSTATGSRHLSSTVMASSLSSSSTSSSSPGASSNGLGGTTRPALGNGHSHGGARRKPERLIEGLVRIIPVFMDLTMRILGPILVMFAWGLFGAVTYIYFWHILPMRSLDVWTFPGNIYTAVGLFILINLYYNHAAAVFTSPGHPQMEPPPNIEQLIAEEAPLLRRGENFARYCRTCVRPKPDRAHHCHICHKCVLKMDHHCPWIANCVGHANYKFFFLFLVYLWVGCIYLVFMCAPAVFWSVSPDLRHHEGSVFFALVLGGAAMVALAVMGILHAYLISTNQSTIELYTNRKLRSIAIRRGEAWSNKYDLGFKKNFQQVFGVGRYWFSWLMPGKPDIGDGHRFATVTGSASDQELLTRAV